MATETPEPDSAPTPSPLRDDELEPVPRDTRFVVRLVLALLVGLLAALWLAHRMQRGAASCGGNLLRPGGSVIPAER